MSTQELHPFTGHYLVYYTRPAAAGENMQVLADLEEEQFHSLFEAALSEGGAPLALLETSRHGME